MRELLLTEKEFLDGNPNKIKEKNIEYEGSAITPASLGNYLTT